MRTIVFGLAALALLTACASFPEIDALGPETGVAPTLLPMDQLLDQARMTAADPGPSLLARAARLRARAAAIKAGPPPT